MTVKAYPNPQEDYGEASCTAGITSAGAWVRVNPVPFRHLRDDQKFEKWEWIRAELRKSADARRESHDVRPDSITVLRKVDTGPKRDWAERNRLIAPFFVGTVDELIAAAKARQRTMGYLRPTRVKRLVIEPRPQHERDWSQKQAAKLGRQQLFGRTPAPLRRVPYKFHYEFDCAQNGCRGHKMQVLDWEIHQSYWSWHAEKGEDGWEDAIRQKYERWMIERRDLVFNLGNTAARQHVFVICALHYPPKASEVEHLEAPTLALRLFGENPPVAGVGV